MRVLVLAAVCVSVISGCATEEELREREQEERERRLELAHEVRETRRAAEQGDARAKFNLGEMHRRGRGVAQDYAAAAEWYIDAAFAGSALAEILLGVMAHNEGQDGFFMNIPQSAEWWRKAAERGDAIAQFNLGEMHRREHGVAADRAADYAAAKKWLRKLAEQGHAVAQTMLGSIYLLRSRGFYLGGIEEAKKWYRKAAEQGYAPAQSLLGEMIMSYSAEGGEEWEEWFRKAAEQGDARAQAALGGMLHRDGAEAVKWSRKAAEQGHAFAQNNLGWAYQEGVGVAQDFVLAYMWYYISIDSGSGGGRAAGHNVSNVTWKMTPDQLAEGERLARECIARDYKDC